MDSTKLLGLNTPFHVLSCNPFPFSVSKVPILLDITQRDSICDEDTEAHALPKHKYQRVHQRTRRRTIAMRRATAIRF